MKTRILKENTQILEDCFLYREDCIAYLVKRTGCHEKTAEEAFMEGLTDMLQLGSDKVNELSNLKSYVIKVSYNHLKRIYYAEKRQTDAMPKVVRYFYDQYEDNELKEEKIHVILQCLNDLAEKCTQLLRLYYFEKLTMQEIAERMEYQTAHVATSAKYRCMQSLKEKVRAAAANL